MKYCQLIITVTVFTLSIVSEIFPQSIGTKVQITQGTYQKAECSIAIDPTNSNNLTACTMTLTGDNTTKVGTLSSIDGGTTWNRNEVLNSEYDVDPSVAYDANGNVFLCYIYNVEAGTNKIYVQKSVNKGQTWQTRIDLQASADADKSFIAIDKHISSQYKNNIYVVWNKNQTTMEFSKSTDGGVNFSQEVAIISGSQSLLGVIPVTGNNGEIYIAYSIGNPNCTGIGFVKSTDGGATFSSQQQIAPVSQIGVFDVDRYKLKSNRIRVNSHPSMSVDPVTGYIYVVYASKSVNGDADVMLVKSTDNGTSWSTPIKVNNDNTNTDQWFPWIDISSSGEINVVFYDSRVDPVNNNLSEVYIARSIDGGNTFGNYDVSNSPFQPQALPNSPSENFMGDYIGITSANQIAFPVWTDNTSGTFQIYTSKVNYNQSVTIDQKRESGASLTGTTVAKWEGSSFVNYQVPATFNFSTGSSVVLRGLQDVVQSPSEKFNKWSIDANVINHRAITIEPGMNQIISQFKSIQPDVTIENLLESSSVGNGTISFADPWLIDFNETPYGTRNQGINALPKARTSPFHPDYTTYYSSDIYKGVFLNQNYNITGQPYYSIQAQSTQTINGYTSYFQNWSASGANIQSTTALTTPVVFTSAGATVTANYKGNLISNSNTGFNSNSQRKVVRTDDGKLHMVYESMNQVWYTYSTDGGTTWQPEQKVDNFSTNTKSCSISQNSNIVFIVYQSDLGTGTIRAARFENGVRSWVTDVYTLSSYSYDTQPVIAAYGSDGGLVVFKPTSTSPLRARNVKCSSIYCTAGTVGTDFQISYSTANSTSPSLVYNVQRMFLAFQEGSSEIRYVKLSAGTDYESVLETSLVSSGSPFTNNQSPSISVQAENSVISWDGFNTPIPSAVVIRKIGSTWSNFNTFGSGTVRYTNNNSRRDGGEGSIIAWCDIYNAHKFVKLDTGNYSSILTLPVGSGNGQIQVSNGIGFADMKAVAYQQPTSGIYPVKFVNYNFLTLQKVNGTGNMNYGRMAIIQQNNKDFVYYLGDVKVDGKNIKFKSFVDSLKIENPEIMNEIMSTESFPLNSKSELTFSNSYYAYDNTNYKEAKGNEVANSIELVNTNGKTVKAEFNASDYDQSKLTDNKTSYKVDCSNIEDGIYYLRIKSKPSGNASYYVNDMESEEPATLNKSFNEIKIAENAVPTGFVLGDNYPNPFNPTTKISFSLPQKSQVKLKVFDVLGREIQILADGVYEAGVHEVEFNATNLPSGVYFYNLTNGSNSITKKMLLMK